MSSHSHPDPDFRYIAGGYPVDLEETHGQFEIGLNFIVQIETSEFLVHFPHNEKCRVRRQPTAAERTRDKGIGCPVTHHLVHVDAVDVHQVRITGLRIFVFERSRNAFQDPVVCVDIVGIEKTDNIAGGRCDALVHGVVQPVIGFGDEMKRVGCFEYFKRTVGRTAIDDNVFNVTETLCPD